MPWQDRGMLRWGLAGSIAVAIVVVLPASARVSAPAPFVVSLDAVAGVRPMMGAEQVRRLWDVRFPVVESSSGSANVSEGALCRAGQRAALSFSLNALRHITFFGITRTDRRVGIGSTLAELRAAYGAELTRLVPSESERGYHEAGVDRPAFRTASKSTPRTLIDFVFKAGRVYKIVWGAMEPRGPIYGITC
jgi:hypothetical protein